MTLYRLVFVALLAFCVVACSDKEGGHRLDPYSPYGIWLTERGHVIVITRDDGYVYCDKAQCMNGKIRWNGLGPILMGFVASPVTQKLRTDSQFDDFNNYLSKYSTEKKYDLDFYAGSTPDEVLHKKCDYRPCISIGNLETNVYRFVKIEDF